MSTNTSHAAHTRIRIIAIALIAFVALLTVRLYFLQVISQNAFLDKADRQYQRTVNGTFDRGTIYFSNKDGSRSSAATLKTGYTIAINPKIMDDPEDVYQKLSTIIQIDKSDFVAKAAKKNDPYEELAKRVPEESAIAIDALDISSVGAYRERWRYYPGNKLASNVLGFVGFKGDELGGRYGLERFYDDVLSRDSKKVYVNFFAQMFSNLNETITGSETHHEGDIVTTIEPAVQALLEEKLNDINTKFNSRYSGGVIIDPMSGEIVAMATSPTYDPNSYGDEKDPAIFGNSVVENVYEMGSIIKPITMASGIDAGVVTPETTYDDTGSLTLNGRTVYNFDKRGRGVVSMQEVLNQSLNTGAAYVARKLGTLRFKTYLDAFGFATTTNIDLPNEGVNLMGNLENGRDIEFATASYGQGIALTPISTIRALSVLANGGTLITPHVVKTIDYSGLLPKEIEPAPGARVLKPETSQTISRMLTQVVDKALLDGTVKMEHYSIAAKTGTALLNRPDGGYYDDRFLHSFFGYFPSYNPRFLVFLYTLDPKGEIYSSHTLTMPFIDLADFLVSYYNIPPDR